MEMEAAGDTSRSASAVSRMLGPKACDECRARKIRCDRLSPCSHCKTAGLSCHTTRNRPQESRSRVIITKQYETKIDRIESRLASIEELLRSNIANSPQSQGSHSMQPNTDRVNHNRNSSLDDTNGINVPFSGYTGPNADSILAKNVVERTVGGSPLVLQDAHLKAALTSLQDIVDRLKLDTSGPNGPELSQSADYPIPGWEEVDSILYGQDFNSNIIFMLCSPAMDFSNFAHRCKELYEQQHNSPPTSRLLVYSGLYCLCSAYSALYEGEKAMYFDKLARMYQQRTLQVLAEVPMVVPATVENVEALLSGAAFAIDMCKPSLSRTLTCAAARLCQTLGYYRIATMSNDSPDLRNRKILQFWLVYMMDRNISLRLGHAPTIQDYEISLPKPEPSESCPASLAHLVSYWIDVSRIQGQICEHLYSPAACAQPNDVRIGRAQALAEELEKVYEARMGVDDEIVALFSMNGSTSIMAQQLISGGDTIMHHSTLTLILHAIPNTRTGVSPAVEAARAALRASPNLSECNTKNNYFWTQYCHWITLNTPLTPFTVLFCHVIANYHSANDDLRLLQNFVIALQGSRQVSEGVDKFYQLCSMFLKVAQTYVHAKQEENKLLQSSNDMSSSNVGFNSWQPAIGELDDYLSVLGFAPLPNTDQSNSFPASSGIDTSMSSHLQDWYSGNASLYGLLEQDLSNIGGFGNEQSQAWYA